MSSILRYVVMTVARKCGTAARFYNTVEIVANCLSMRTVYSLPVGLPTSSVTDCSSFCKDCVKLYKNWQNRKEQIKKDSDL